MVLVLSNEDVAKVLNMEVCMEALEEAYKEQAEGRAVNQLRYDTNMPLPERPERLARYEFKTMVGILPKVGVAALRMSSTLDHRPIRYGVERAERLYLAPGGGTVGLIQLYRTETGEPLAFMPDGVVQGMRVGGSFGLALKYLARKNSSVMGLLGTGWQARFQVASAKIARNISLVKVYSPNPQHREQFAHEVGEQYRVKIQPVDSIEGAARDVDVLVAATNARAPLIMAEHVQKGMHVAAVQNEISDEALSKADLLVSHTEQNYWIYEGGPGKGQYGQKAEHGSRKLQYGKMSLLDDVIAGRVGRKNDDEITMFRGHGLGLQFAAVGAKVYELAKKQGLGHEIPTEWFTQTLHT
jgi:ornithine cyclodeaminase/alanine dehydrogenase-like protein (mu-crystallin family)